MQVEVKKSHSFIEDIESSVTTPFRHWKEARAIQSYLKEIERDPTKVASFEKNDHRRYESLIPTFRLPHKEMTFPDFEFITPDAMLPKIENVEARLRVREGKFVLTYFGEAREHRGQRPVFSNRALTTIRLAHAVDQGLTLEKLEAYIAG